MKIANILNNDIQALKMYYNGNVVWEGKPYKQEVEGLIANSPDAYLITDIILNDITDMEFEITGKCVAGSTMLFGVRDGSYHADTKINTTLNAFTLLGNAGAGGVYALRTRINSDVDENSNMYLISDDVTTFNIKNQNDIKTIFINGTSLAPNQIVNFKTSWSKFIIAYPLVLFGCNSEGVIDNTTNPRQINYFKLTLHGEIVAEYIPVLDYDDRPCFYDKVSKRLLYSSGTEDFQYI